MSVTYEYTLLEIRCYRLHSVRVHLERDCTALHSTWIRIKTRKWEPPTLIPCWLHSHPGPGVVGFAGFKASMYPPLAPGVLTSVLSVQSTDGLASATSMGSLAVSVMQPT